MTAKSKSAKPAPKKTAKTAARGKVKKASAAVAPVEPTALEGMTEQEVDRLIRAFQRGVCVQASFGGLGVRRKVRVRGVEAAGEGVKLAIGDAAQATDAKDDAADRSKLRVHKVILDVPEYDAVWRRVREAKGVLEAAGIPTILGNSVYVVPVRTYRATMAAYDAKLAEWRAAVDAFAAVYADARAKAKTELGPMFDPRDYPPEDEVRAAFWSRTRRGFRITADESLRGVDPDAFDAAVADLRRETAEAALEIRALMRRTFAELVGHLADRLTGRTEDGRPAILRDSAVENLREFTALFDAKDITSDAALRGHVERMRQLLDGVDVDALRDDEKFRARVGKLTAEVKTSLDGLVTDAPARRLRWTPKPTAVIEPAAV